MSITKTELLFAVAISMVPPAAGGCARLEDTEADAVNDTDFGITDVENAGLLKLHIVDPYDQVTLLEDEAHRLADDGKPVDAATQTVEAVRIARLIDDPSELARVLFIHASTLAAADKSDQAIRSLKEALEIGNKNDLNPVNRVAILHQLAAIHHGQGSNYDAFQFMAGCVDLLVEVGDADSLALHFCEMARLALDDTGRDGVDPDTAANCIEAVFAISTPISIEATAIVSETVDYVRHRLPGARFGDRRLSAPATTTNSQRLAPGDRRSLEIRALNAELARLREAYRAARLHAERVYAAYSRVRNLGQRRSGTLAAQGMFIGGGEFSNYDIEAHLGAANRGVDDAFNAIREVELRLQSLGVSDGR